MNLKEIQFTILIFFAAAISVFLLHTNDIVNPVIASAVLGFIGTYIPIGKMFERSFFEACWYSGSFAGMTSSFIAQSPIHIFLISIFSGMIFYFTQQKFKGVGGKLGSIAFMGVVLFHLGEMIWK